MNNKRATKRALLTSVMALVMCVVMLVGTTFAWFTDTASTGVNKIQAGNLKVDIVKSDDNGSIKGESMSFVNKDGSADILWEPGVTFRTPGFKIKNDGNLALKYKLALNGVTGSSKLLEVIRFSVVTAGATDNSFEAVDIDRFEGHLAAGATDDTVLYIQGHMDKNAGNEYQGLELTGLGITVYATQDNVENDSFGPDYDKYATYYPVLDAAGMKDALVNGGNIKVDANVDVGADALAVTKDTTIDMNGKTLTTIADIWDESKMDWSLISARNGANLTITGNGTFKAKENDSFAVDVQDGSIVTIENGTFIGNMDAVYVEKGTVYIKGGFFDIQQKSNGTGEAQYRFMLNCLDANYGNGSANIIVTGGTFVNFNPANCQAEGPNTKFVASGYSVISETKANGDVWYTVVKGTGATAGTQEALENAISGNNVATVKLTTSGTYTLPTNKMANKDVTIIGTKDTVIDMKNVETGQDTSNAKIALEGVTVEFANADYMGFQHTGKLTYKDCTITGKQFLYATEVEFINCTFVQDAVDYNVWTYGAGSVLFKDCTFNCAGKSVLIYRENSSVGQTVEFQNCKFKASASVEGKAAIEIDSSLLKDDAIYKVVIDQATVDNVTGFDNGSASNNSVWNNKSGSRATVIVAGNTVLTATK